MNFEKQVNETLKRKFIYTKHGSADDIVFQCVADSITEADKKYEVKFGKNPREEEDLGCEVEKIPRHWS